MNKRTLKALKKSIEHWRENVQAETPDDAATGPEECALCNMFWSYLSPTCCDGCPVKNSTGQVCCEGSPYIDAQEALSKWSSKDNQERKIVWQQAAQAELDFLIGLLLEGGKCDD